MTSGPQCDVVAAVVPLVARAGEQVFAPRRSALWVDRESFEIEIDPARLLVVRIEIDRDQNAVVAVVASFAVAEELGLSAA